MTATAASTAGPPGTAWRRSEATSSAGPAGAADAVAGGLDDGDAGVRDC